MSGFFSKILEISLLTSVAAGVLWLLSRFLYRKTKPGLRYICWVIVALCFLIPVRPALFAVALSGENPNAVSAFADTFFPHDENTDQTPQTAYLSEQTKVEQDTVASAETLPQSALAQASFSLTFDTAARTVSWDWAFIFSCVWVLGMLVSLAMYAVGYTRFVRGIRQTCAPVTNSALGDLLSEVCDQIRLKRRLGLAISPVIHTPVVVGFFRPTVFLPCEPVNRGTMQMMLMHEALHIKGGHMWGKLLSMAAMIVHWFNPTVYLANRAMLTESEMACDAAVLRYTGEEQRLAYGKTIYQTAARGGYSAATLVSAFAGNGKNLKRRLSAIVERNTTQRWVATCCAVVMLSGLMLTGLVSCTRDNDNNVIVDPIPDTPVDLTPTEELVIYIPNASYITKDIQAAVSRYEETYKDVSVTLEIIGDPLTGDQTPYIEQYKDRLNSELMAGTGPDIVFVGSLFFPDIYKTMDTGSFLDLSSIVEQDEDFLMEDYYQSVLDVGLYKGGRYIVPYSFGMPILFGLQEQLDSVGFDMAKNTDFVSFFNELTDSLPKAMENPSFTAAFNQVWYVFRGIHEAGLTLIDYEHKKVLPDESEFKAFCEAFKPYWEIDYQDRSKTRFQYDRLLALNAGDYLFVGDGPTIPNYIHNIAEAKGDNSAWVMSAIRGMDGGINATMDGALAIRAGSKNQLNAWNFIKVMLTLDIQMGTYQEGPSVYMPVNRAAMSNIINKTQNQDGGLVSALTGTKWVPAVTLEEKQVIYDLLDGITGCSVWNYAVFDYFYECMTPYFNDERSYDECVAELKSKLRLYVSE